MILTRDWWMQTVDIGGYPASFLELFGVITGLACVYLTVRQNIWCWPIGIISALAFGWLFYDVRLYADVWLQGFFIATSVYGWHWWLRGGPNFSRAQVSVLNGAQRWIVMAVTVLAVVTIGYYHANYTNADLPRLDALASGGSVTAQLLMMRKKIECWPLWIAIDVLSVYIYLYKQLYFTAALYLVFCFLAALGLYQWHREWHSKYLQMKA